MVQFLLKKFKKKFGANKHYYRLVDQLFGAYPNNIELYKVALIHRSASYELVEGKTINNERLEYLGDAVLDAIVSDYLFIEFPNEDEGFLTQVRSRIVSGQTLNELAIELGLPDYIVSQAGIGVVQKHLFGDALEAMIGALYLDKGYDFVNRLVINEIVRKHINMDEVLNTENDYKSRLIEWCQKSKHTIHFETDFSEESTVQNPTFKAVAVIDDMELGFGIGDSKKEAEQMASYTVSKMMSEEWGDNVLHWVDEQMERKFSEKFDEPLEIKSKKDDQQA